MLQAVQCSVVARESSSKRPMPSCLLEPVSKFATRRLVSPRATVQPDRHQVNRGRAATKRPASWRAFRKKRCLTCDETLRAQRKPTREWRRRAFVSDDRRGVAFASGSDGWQTDGGLRETSDSTGHANGRITGG